MVRGVAALVTSAAGDEGASQRVLPYQPSEHLARIARVRRPGASERFRVMDNRLHSLRKSPAQLLRGRLPRLIEQAMIERQVSVKAVDRTTEISTERQSGVGQKRSGSS